MKKLFAFILLLVLPAAWYLLSPLWNVVEADDASPFRDNLESMNSATQQQFEAAVEGMRGERMEMEESNPADARIIAQAPFQPRAHDVAGDAILIQTGHRAVLRFENFETVNGPDLYIYLASELGGDDFVDLGKIKATRGNVNYEIPEGTDLSKYTKVLVWCRPFGVLFSYAELSKI